MSAGKENRNSINVVAGSDWSRFLNPGSDQALAMIFPIVSFRYPFIASPPTLAVDTAEVILSTI